MIGLLPAAGQATRMNGLPKYLLPINKYHCLLTLHVAYMLETKCKRVYIGANKENYKLLKQHSNTAITFPAAHYETMAETLLSILEWGKKFARTPILFGMPDTYFEDTQAYRKLADVLSEGAQVAVGLFRARPGQHTKVGMCRIDGNHVTEVIDKPESTDLEWLWGVLAWQPAFWDYIKPEDPHVGYALPRAIAAGLDVRAVKMDGRYWDCGTSEEYFECIRAITSEA